jgi:solute carrier family 12 (sodium/potassium/chloride transporter), member 2
MYPDVSYYVDPKRDGLRPKSRPHIMQLIDGGKYGVPEQLDTADDEIIKYMPGYNFGWIEGVLIRCTLSIFGVLMFLRLNWMFAEAGVIGALGIILWSVAVTCCTTQALSALSTNGSVKGGGVYYMVSRALGAEFGAVVGITLFIAQSAAVSLHLTGFGEAVAILEDGDYVFDKTGDRMFFAIIGLIAVLGSSFLGANFEVQSQKILAVSMAIALVTFYFGCFLSNGNSDINSTPMSSKSFSDNFAAHYTGSNTWLTVFGVFFPACTGISAGSSISGDLKDPQEAIPKGTFAAIVLTTIIYVSMGLLMCAVFTPEGLSNITTQISAIDISLVPEIMYLGMFAAALSSALALVVGAPRVLMAVARDDILPQLAFFKKSYFSKEEPLRGYLTVVLIAFVCIIALDLNTVSPIVTNFFLVQYGLINYSVFHAHISKAPGWRPSFKYWSPWISLLGACMCFVSMFMVDWTLAIVTIICSVGLFQYVVHIKPDVNWGDSGVAHCQKQAVEAIYRMERLKDHVKNYRPQFLLLTKDPKQDVDIISLTERLKKTRGMFLIGRVIIGDMHDENTFRAMESARKDVVLLHDEIIAILQVICAPSLLSGVESLLQLAGFGKLKPNTVLIGFKENWKTSAEAELTEYIQILRACFATRHAVCILRNSHVALNYVPAEVSVVINTGENLYSPEIQKGHIDVWWLIEDGGLLFLLAYLMSRHREYRGNAQLRLFGLISVSATADEVKKEKERLLALLERFRFHAELILVQHDIAPDVEEIHTFADLLGTDAESVALTEDTRTILNISHHLKVHSTQAHVVMISLPVPKTTFDDRVYFAYMDMLSSTGRPTFLARGNQQTVLSIHS